MEEIREQVLPAPDEAPLTYCPWCGQEYCIREEDGLEDYTRLGCPHEGTYPKPCAECEHWDEYCHLPSRHRCGGLVKFRCCTD